MKTKLLTLKAFNGDCLLIKTFDNNEREYTILIDGGTGATFEQFLKPALREVKTIDLLILTHIDSDHIHGLIIFFKSSLFTKIDIKRYWMNLKNLVTISSGENISYGEAITLEKLIASKEADASKFSEVITTDSGTITLTEGITATILSPRTKELNLLKEGWPDYSAQQKKEHSAEVPVAVSLGVAKPELTFEQLANTPFIVEKPIEKDIFNATSIAFILQLPDCRLLLLGDGRPEVICESLRALGYNDTDNRLAVDYVKIAHHGSKHNTSNELLGLIDCQRFIISTNGGASTHKHPDRETIARIVHHPKRNFDKPVNVYFNYSLESMIKRKGDYFLPADKASGNWIINDNVNELII